ncbi:hypothetical protein C8Q76DRAFT_821403 [Earliella scabrosa]|nr:hypothetical protein C8Q76DRAFT_821403 [Earliella scabrosa]
MPRSQRPDPDWFPWPDKQTCVLDILRHLPQSLFSDAQMEITLWAMDIFQMDNRPSLFVLKMIDKMLQDGWGIDSIRHEGPLGHIYYLNDLGAIIAQELGNLRMQPHLRFYPEDGGPYMKESWHGQ